MQIWHFNVHNIVTLQFEDPLLPFDKVYAFHSHVYLREAGEEVKYI